jgi:hypothetical protein
VPTFPPLYPENMKRITTFFGYTLTPAEVVQGIDLVGNRALVTGSASGIDIETVQAPASGGAAVDDGQTPRQQTIRFGHRPGTAL